MTGIDGIEQGMLQRMRRPGISELGVQAQTVMSQPMEQMNIAPVKKANHVHTCSQKYRWKRRSPVSSG